MLSPLPHSPWAEGAEAGGRRGEEEESAEAVAEAESEAEFLWNDTCGATSNEANPRRRQCEQNDMPFPAESNRGSGASPGA
jgi:hypothetical protein